MSTLPPPTPGAAAAALPAPAPAPRWEPSVALLERLSQAARFDCEYGRGLANHLPMALASLARLGADEARLAAFEAGYVGQLKAAAPARAWPAGSPWRPPLGRRAAWAAYRSLFAEWIGHEGSSDVLAQVLPWLWPGVAAAGFHGLIRTASAVRCGHVGEVAEGLAYWSCRYLPLGELPGVPGAGRRAHTDPVALLRRLRAGASNARLIAERMREVARDGEVNRVAAQLVVTEETPRLLARAAAQALAGSGDFTALHLVTSAHAMRVLTRFVDEPLAGWRAYWQAYAHAVVAARLQRRPAAELLGWEALERIALVSDDEHVIKLVDSCREEERAWAEPGEALWRQAASQYVGRTSVPG
jgi:predicted RNA-binding Zn ribbon-like protein